MELAQKMLDEIWEIFEEHGGYDYNDTMYYQALGSSESFSETELDDDWDGLIEEFETVLNYMRHIQKIRILQESIPDEIYC